VLSNSYETSTNDGNTLTAEGRLLLKQNLHILVSGMYNSVQPIKWRKQMSDIKNKNKKESRNKIYSLPLTEARNTLGKVVKRSYLNKDTFILEKDGVPMAALMNIDDFEDYLDSRDEELKKELRQSHQDYLDGNVRPFDEFLAELNSKKK